MPPETELKTEKSLFETFKDFSIGFLTATALILAAFAVFYDQVFDKKDLQQTAVQIPNNESERAETDDQTQVLPQIKATKVDTIVLDTSITVEEMDRLIEQYKDAPGFYQSSEYGGDLRFFVIPKLYKEWESEGPGDIGKSYTSDVYVYVGMGNYKKFYSFLGSNDISEGLYSHVTLVSNQFAGHSDGDDAMHRSDVAFILSNSFNCCGGGGGPSLINRLFLYSSENNTVTVYTFDMHSPFQKKVSDYFNFITI